jgi:hypothetical protein
LISDVIRFLLTLAPAVFPTSRNGNSHHNSEYGSAVTEQMANSDMDVGGLQDPIAAYPGQNNFEFGDGSGIPLYWMWDDMNAPSSWLGG